MCCVLRVRVRVRVCDSAESIIVAKYYAGKHHYTVSPNRELVALGSANMVGSFFRIFPSFGSLVRSALGTFDRQFRFIIILIIT
jgi:MFS superfamily sulfate permease-like transporter